LWIVPAKVGGAWKLPQGELRLKQSFQMITGTLKSGNVIAPVNGKLNGDQIIFTAGEAQYTGRVNGSSINGTLKSAGSWKATRIGN
ncbi:MAG: SAM-dependent methyltransferase, partial [Candidatus Binatia bacterium]